MTDSGRVLSHQSDGPAPYYSDDFVTIYHGDCREILPGLAPVDLVLTDPPYNCVNRASGGLRELDKGTADSAPVDIAEIAEHLIRLATGSIYVWCGDSQFSDWVNEFKNAELTVRGGVWHKTNPSPMNGERMWLSAVEFCAFARKSQAYFDEFCQPNLWLSPTEAGDHPTPKPLKLMQRLVMASCPADGTVLDPFMGAGTTLRAAKNVGRRAVGIEIEEQWCETAVRRLGQEVFDFGEAA